MALPKLNEHVKYELEVPSTGKKIQFRPFLVKEQNVLLIAFESRDRVQIVQAMLDTIQSCTYGLLNINELATFDIDYIFMKIRSKSVGEKADVSTKCSKCEGDVPIVVNIDDIEIPKTEISNVIPLTKEISVKMKYPSYSDFTSNPAVFEENSTATDTLMNFVIGCMESIQTEDENILIKDESHEEIVTFIDSLNQEQFNNISNFVADIPKMSYPVEYTCPSCSHEDKIELQGLEDFF